MQQTKQHLQQEIERLRARLAAFGITEEMEPGTTMVITNVQPLGLHLTAPVTTAPSYILPALCDMCGKPAVAFFTIGTSAVQRSYCQEHNPARHTTFYASQVTTDGKPIY